MAAAARLARVAGVLVLRRDRLYETNRIELAALRRGVDELDEFLLVAQVRSRFRTWREGCVVVERVVVELELPVRTVGISGVGDRVGIRAGRPVAIGPTRCADISVRIRPPTRVPRPTDARRAQFVA